MMPNEFTEFIPYSVFLQRMRLMAVPKGFSTLLVLHESTQICVELRECATNASGSTQEEHLMVLAGRLVDRLLFEEIQKQTNNTIEYGAWLNLQSAYENGIVMTNERGSLFRLQANLRPEAAPLLSTKSISHYVDSSLPKTALYIETFPWVIAHKKDVNFTFVNSNTVELRFWMGINRVYNEASFTLQGVNHVG